MDRRREPIHPLTFGLFRKFNDQNGVLCSQSDQNDQPDIDQDISVKASHVHANHGSQDAHRNDENHGERQNPALVKAASNRKTNTTARPKAMIAVFPASFSCSAISVHSNAKPPGRRSLAIRSAVAIAWPEEKLRDKLRCTSAAGNRL